MNVTELKQQLYFPKTDKNKLFSRLINETTFDKFEKTITQVLTHPFTKTALFGIPLPQEYHDIKRIKTVYTTSNLEGEMAWTLYAIKQHAGVVNNFVEKKLQFEKHLLKGEYAQAETILIDIETNISKSLWSIENRLFLNEVYKGTEANWTELSNISKTVNDWFVLFLTENYSKRAETKISYFRYKELLSSKVESINHQPLMEYFYFKLNYPAYTGFDNFPFILSVENSSPIIDRYLNLLDVLSEMVTNPKKPTLPGFVVKTIEQLSDSVFDKRLVQLSSIASDRPIQMLAGTELFLEIIDQYTKGEFASCLEKSTAFLIEYPYSIELSEVYVKSLIELKRDFVAPGISKIVDDTLKHLFNVFSRNDRSFNSTSELLKIALALFSTGWGKQLYSVLEQQTKKDELLFNHLIFILNSSFNNPQILLNDSLPESNLALLSTFFQAHFPGNEAIKINTLSKQGDYRNIINDLAILSKRKYVYVARALQQARDFEALKAYCKEALLDVSISACIYEELNTKLYTSLIQLKDKKESLQLYIDVFIKNDSLTVRLDEDKLLNLLEEDSFKEIENLIEFPVFYRLATMDAYRQYVAYDVFISTLNIERPTEITNHLELFSNEKVVFFLREVCTVEILHYSLYFTGLDDIESERLKILRVLLQIDSEQEAVYIKEIAELAQNANIRKAIREVNKGRITVNVSQLKNIEANNVKEGFSRYEQLIKYSNDNKDVVGVDISPRLIRDYLKNLFEDKNQNPTGIRNDPAFIYFKTMFLDLRDKYILSKEYGLDGYLSTRIRHGTLENHIRSVFQNHHLISEKNKIGNYSDIDFWAEKIPYQAQYLKDDIQEIFKSFSKKVDEIIQHIIREQIQVYTEKQNAKPKALFNYRFTDDYLWLSFNIVKDTILDHNQFLDFAFNELEYITERHLEDARVIFNTDIKDIFVQLLDELQERISRLLQSNSFNDLSTSINRCRTEIQNELRNISEWFNLSNPSTDLMLDIETILRTSVEITNSIYPNFPLVPDIETTLNVKVVSTIHLIYLTRIILDNIIKHSGVDANGLIIKIEAALHNRDFLRLTFTNNLSMEKDITLLKETLNKVKTSWNDKANFERSNIEGGSGFDKIRRILAFDIKCKKYGFDYLIDERNLTIMIDIDLF